MKLSPGKIGILISAVAAAAAGAEAYLNIPKELVFFCV